MTSEGDQLYIHACVTFSVFTLLLLRALWMLGAYLIQRHAEKSRRPSMTALTGQTSTASEAPSSPGPLRGAQARPGRMIRSFVFIACFAFLVALQNLLHITKSYTSRPDFVLHAIFIFGIMFLFLVYSVLLYNWRSVAKMVSSNYTPSRMPLLILNVTICCVTVTDWVLYFSYRKSEERNRVVGVMNLFIAIVCFCIAIAFWNIGGRLLYILYAKSLHKSRLHIIAFRKILVLTIVSSVCLAVYGGFMAWEGLYLVEHDGFMVVIDGEWVQVASIQYVYTALTFVPTCSLLLLTQTGPTGRPVGTSRSRTSSGATHSTNASNGVYSPGLSKPLLTEP